MSKRTGRKAGAQAITAEQLIAAWVKHKGSFRQTARELGCDDRNVARRIRGLYDAGDERIDPKLLFGERPLTNQPGGFSMDEVNRARLELGMRNDAKAKKGDWRKASLITKIKDPVFVLGLFGDPHLDNAGTDLDLFEDELSNIDNVNTFGICIGDVFDNWIRVLAHAGSSSTDPYCGWIVYNDFMERHPFLGLILGNHDIWNTGTANVLTEHARSVGMVVRRSGGRFIIDTGTGAPLTISARHIWQGNSMYSEAHPQKRAVMHGHTSDDIVTGGHFHKGEKRAHVRPEDKKISHLVALDAFKRFDDHANDKGYMSAETPPVVWCAIDTREPVTSWKRVQPFYDYSEARAIAEHRRAANG